MKSFAPPEPLSWEALQGLAVPEPDLVEGPTNARSSLRLFGHGPQEVRVTLYRDHHAWCPYCQKVWLWLEERRIPYRIRKVTMFCYGEKERWFTRLVPSGMLPALELDGQLITESDRILEALEQAFGSLGPGLQEPRVRQLRQLERLLFRAWCQWLCVPGLGPAEERRARQSFDHYAALMGEAIETGPGPFLLGELSSADVVFVPYLERMNASLAYEKGYLLRRHHPAIDGWFTALEQRSTYLGTQSDFHTHAHDLPPQMGGCHANGSPEQRLLAARIDHGPWPIVDGEQPDPETSQVEPADSPALALARVLKHRFTLLQRNPLGQAFERPLRCALTSLISGGSCPPPPGSAAGLRYLRDRISVPRDMPLHAARQLRGALERVACLDPREATRQGPPIPRQHRRDQDPMPFLRSQPAGAAAGQRD
ncbi:MAG: glutathione S-transferase family protein [Cyanobium sp.]